MPLNTACTGAGSWATGASGCRQLLDQHHPRRHHKTANEDHHVTLASHQIGRHSGGSAAGHAGLIAKTHGSGRCNLQRDGATQHSNTSPGHLSVARMENSAHLARARKISGTRAAALLGSSRLGNFLGNFSTCCGKHAQLHRGSARGPSGIV